MKKLIMLVALAAMTFGIAASASAVEIKALGSWRVHANMVTNFNNDFMFDSEDNNASEDDFDIQQRMRTRFRFIANENLMGELYTEIGNFGWGQTTDSNGNTAGGRINQDARNIEFKRGFIQWKFPNTDILMTVGKQDVTLPNSGYFSSPILSDDATAAVITSPINDMFAVSLGYSRFQDQNVGSDATANSVNDEFDAIWLAVPITPEGMKITPFFVYAWLGDSLPLGGMDLNGLGTAARPLPANFDAFGDDSQINPWWAGVAFNLDMFDPIVAEMNFYYGDAGTEDDFNGWWVDGMVAYKGLEWFTPELFLAYSTGQDDDTNEIGVMPTLISNWGPTGSVINGSNFTTDQGAAQPGFWTVGLALRDITFMEKLSHELLVYYVQGTNDKNATFTNSSVTGLSEDDSFIGIDFNNEYKIYENLAAILEMGAYVPDFDNNSAFFTNGDEAGTAYKAALGVVYNF